MKTNFEKVIEFHEVFGSEINYTPTLVGEDLESLRILLIEEELGELKEALSEDNLVSIADALTDILYVVYGAGVTYGIDLDATFAEVHRSNMSKLGENGEVVEREDGKVLKGPDYTPPNLFKILFGE